MISVPTTSKSWFRERSLCLNLELNVYKMWFTAIINILLTGLFYPIQFEFQIKLEATFEVI
jgi:hypothetical protein